MKNTLFTTEEFDGSQALIWKKRLTQFQQITEAIQIITKDARDAVETLQVLFPGEYERDDRRCERFGLEIWHGSSDVFGSFIVVEEYHERVVKISFKDFGEYTVKILH